MICHLIYHLISIAKIFKEKLQLFEKFNLAFILGFILVLYRTAVS